MHTEVHNAVTAADQGTQYDESAKRLLGQKSILAQILVRTVDEFKGMNPRYVETLIEGEPYNPVEYAVHVRKAKKFAEALNRYFAEKNMDYNCVLDKSACSLDEIFSPQYQAVLFAPEAKTRQWLYKKEVQNETVKKYYLEYMEYNSAQIEKVAEFLSE